MLYGSTVLFLLEKIKARSSSYCLRSMVKEKHIISSLHVVGIPDILIERGFPERSRTSFADSMGQAQIGNHSSLICSQHDLHVCRHTFSTLIYGTANRVQMRMVRILRKIFEGVVAELVPADITALKTGPLELDALACKTL